MPHAECSIKRFIHDVWLLKYISWLFKGLFHLQSHAHNYARPRSLSKPIKSFEYLSFRYQWWDNSNHEWLLEHSKICATKVWQTLSNHSGHVVHVFNKGILAKPCFNNIFLLFAASESCTSTYEAQWFTVHGEYFNLKQCISHSLTKSPFVTEWQFTVPLRSIKTFDLLCKGSNRLAIFQSEICGWSVIMEFFALDKIAGLSHTMANRFVSDFY